MRYLNVPTGIHDDLGIVRMSFSQLYVKFVSINILQDGRALLTAEASIIEIAQ